MDGDLHILKISMNKDYIRQGQKTLSNRAPYWINGSALYDPSVIITFGETILIPGPTTTICTPRIETPNPDYNANTSGSINVLVFCQDIEIFISLDELDELDRNSHVYIPS